MFHTCYDHFEYMIISFDLINMFIIFQTYINKILTKILNDFYVVYLNNILIFFVKKTDYVNHMKQILESLRKFKLYASLKKCKFFIIKVNFLEFIIFTESVSMNLSRVNIIKTWFRSKMYWKIQVFLRFINFYRHFIHHYSQIAKSLTELLRNSVKDLNLYTLVTLIAWFMRNSMLFILSEQNSLRKKITHHLYNDFTSLKQWSWNYVSSLHL